jgi:hypothetical protein
LGEKDHAIERLEKSYRQRDPGLLHLTDTPEYVRADPWFTAMLRKIKPRPLMRRRPGGHARVPFT